MAKRKMARRSAESSLARFCQALQDLLIQQKIYLAPRLGGAGNRPVGATLVGWYGVEDDGTRCVYLLTGPCIQEVKAYWSGAGEFFDVPAEVAQRELHEAGVVIRKDPPQFEARVRVQGVGTPRVLIIDVRKLMSYAEIWLWPEASDEGGDRAGAEVA